MTGTDDQCVVSVAQEASSEVVAWITKAGYRLVMTLKAFCTTCQRTVYVDRTDTPVCPVCSSPLLETVESAGDETAAEK